MDVPTHHQHATLVATLLLSLPLPAQPASDAPDFASMDSPAFVAAERPALAPFTALTVEAWHSRGGIADGGWWVALLDLGVECDLARFGGPDGSSLFVQAHGVKNSEPDGCFGDRTGALNPVSGTMAADHVRLYNFFYRQSWRDDALAIKIGQLAADDDFMLSDYAGLFANAAFGPMPSQVGTSLSSECAYTAAFPIYAVAAPGVWLQLRPRDSFSWQTGVYHGGPGPDEKGNYGFDWERASHAGVLVFTEASWRYNVGRRDATLRLGGSFHSGHFDNYDAIRANRAATTTRGVASCYAVHDLALATDAEGRPRLGLFCRAGISPQRDRSVATAYADAGLNWFAPLPGRPDDIAGAAVSWMRFGRAFREIAGVAASETTVELTYKAQITSRFALQADAQFLFNPAPRAVSGRRETATVVGLRTQFSF